MPPIDPPTTAYHRSMPSASASATSSATWSRIVSPGSATRTAGRRRASRRRPGRALAPAEHVGAHDEEAVGVDRRAGPDRCRPTSRRRRGRARGPGGVAVAGERVQHEHRVRRVGRERAPRLVRDRHRLERAAGLERAGRRRSGANCRRPGSSPGRHAPVTGSGVGPRSSAQRLGGAEPGVEVGEDVVDATRCRPTGARGRA